VQRAIPPDGHNQPESSVEGTARQVDRLAATLGENRFKRESLVVQNLLNLRPAPGHFAVRRNRVDDQLGLHSRFIS
jgi:hypothetical protein